MGTTSNHTVGLTLVSREYTFITFTRHLPLGINSGCRRSHDRATGDIHGRGLPDGFGKGPERWDGGLEARGCVFREVKDDVSLTVTHL